MHRPLTRLAPLLLAVLAVLLLSPASASADDNAQPVVRVGTEGTYPPFSFHDPKTNELTGFDVDVMKAVGKKAGWKVDFVETQWDSMFAALGAKRIDAIANQVSINPERQAQWLMSTPYTYSHGVIVTRSDEKDIKTLADLKGKTAAESATSNWNDVAKKAGAKIQNIDNFAQAATALSQGRVDAIVNDNIAALDYLASTGSKKVRIAGNAGSDVSKQSLTFRKDEAGILKQGNQALAALKADGTLKRISEKYFKADVSVENDQGKVKSDRAGSTQLDLVKHAWWPVLRQLLLVSLTLTVFSFIIGLALGLLAALARISGNAILSGIARVYVSVIRGTPMLVQLFIVFYGLPELGLGMPRYVSGVLALSLNIGGYTAESIRGAVLSVPRGQYEAATTIGLGYWPSLRRVVLPQALRIAVPPLSNSLISLVKDTSLVSVVLLTDAFREAQNWAAPAGKYMAVYCLAAFYYWVVCVIMSHFQGRLEKKLEAYAV